MVMAAAADSADSDSDFDPLEADSADSGGE